MSGSRILVVGAGATGGYFGARLQQAGRDVTFLVRGSRATALRKRGLVLASPEGETTLFPAVATADELNQLEPFDVVLIGVLAEALPQAMEDMAPGVGNGTVVVPFLNGIAHLDLLAQRFETASVFGGVAKVVSFLTDNGAIQWQGAGATLELGDQSGALDHAVEIAHLLSVPGILASATDHILQDMWGKWVFIVSITSITTLMNAPIGRVASVPGGASVAAEIVAEAVAVSSAAGFPFAKASEDGLVRMASDPSSGLATSVFRSMQAGRHTEVETMLGAFIAKAEALGISTPLLLAATVHLRVYEESLSTASAGANDLRKA